MTISFQFEGSAESALALQDEFSDLEGKPQLTYVDNGSPNKLTGLDVVIVGAIIYGGPLLANHVVDIASRIHRRFRSFSVLDLTGDEPKLTVIEDAPGHRGEFVIKTLEGEEATVIDGPEVPREELITLLSKFLPGSEN